MTALAAVVLTSAGFGLRVSAIPFIEYERDATVADLVCVAKCAEAGIIPENQNGIRYDINLDGVIDNNDVSLLRDYILFRMDIDDIISVVSDEATEVLDLFAMEICETYLASPDDFTIEIACWSVADGGYTGYAVSSEPYTGDILYDFKYETGDLVLCTKLTYGATVRYDEFNFGNVSEFGLEYTPRPEVVERALANIDIEME